MTRNIPTQQLAQRGQASIVGLVLATATILSACGGASAPASSAAAAGSAPASSAAPAAAANPFKGKTINLTIAGGAGGSFDLEGRTLAPYLGKQLGATIDVVNLPGGGGLKGWNAVAHDKPDGMNIGIGYIQGQVANVWEKVPGQNFDPVKLTWLGGYAGNRGLTAKVMFANSQKPPFDTLDHLIATKDKVIELGAVGDVSGPLFFKVYNVPNEDLTSYADASAQKVGLLRGDGQVDVKTYPGWQSLVTSGKVWPILDFSLRPMWSVNPKVPTIGAFMKTHPIPAEAQAAMKADAAALDAGAGVFAPVGLESSRAQVFRTAIAAAFKDSGLLAQAKKSHLSPFYLDASQEVAAINTGLEPKTVTIMRKYLPLSQGEAS